MIKLNELVTPKIGKLLLKYGYNERCEYMYGISVKHNGKELSFCDECELKDEGRGDEIEYVDYGTLLYLINQNDENGEGTCSAPRYSDVFDWIEKNFNLYISIYPLFKEMDEVCWTFDVCNLKEKTIKQMPDVDTNREKIMENAIICVLEKTYLTSKEVV